ncbi:hypothetical protein, partial [Dielma fastidiosa]|uniref:hypothetical protein n=1 Tax=Dielma fastidiosa TaxID=1034346 RepID=UPI0023EFDAE5
APALHAGGQRFDPVKLHQLKDKHLFASVFLYAKKVCLHCAETDRQKDFDFVIMMRKGSKK